MINEIMNDYMSTNSRVSLGSMAMKLGVSKSYLSLIKNKQRLPNIEIGLNILKYCKADNDTKARWIQRRNREESQAYAEFESQYSGEKLSLEVTGYLVGNATVLKAFLSILDSEKEGCSKEEILLEFGRHIEEKFSYLIERDALYIKNGIYFANGDLLQFDALNSLRFIASFVQGNITSLEQGLPTGISRFGIFKLSEENQKNAKEMIKRHMEEFQAMAMKDESKNAKKFVFLKMFGELK